MPGASGIDVLRVIRNVRPNVKVLVISGHITPDARKELEALGQRDFIQKPYRLDDIGRRLRTIIGSRTIG
jgi:DNA-binding NarL/FixJ family response regulator